jgi:hypothetical protein
MASCSLVVDKRFRHAPHHQGDRPETPVYFYKTTWHHIPQVFHHHTRRRENLKPHIHGFLTLSFLEMWKIKKYSSVILVLADSSASLLRIR